MTQKSELTPKNDSYPVEYADIPSSDVEDDLVFERLQSEALTIWEMLQLL